jgi:hypothetical protein
VDARQDAASVDHPRSIPPRLRSGAREPPPEGAAKKRRPQRPPEPEVDEPRAIREFRRPGASTL